MDGLATHGKCRSEYQSIIECYEDRECFTYYDGPLVGTIKCRNCGQLFLFSRVRDDDDERVWLFYPTTEEAEQGWKQEQVDPYESIDLLEQHPYVRVRESNIGKGKCRETWVHPPIQSG